MYRPVFDTNEYYSPIGSIMVSSKPTMPVIDESDESEPQEVSFKPTLVKLPLETNLVEPKNRVELWFETHLFVKIWLVLGLILGFALAIVYGLIRLGLYLYCLPEGSRALRMCWNPEHHTD
jgi:hypothetical protein